MNILQAMVETEKAARSTDKPVYLYKDEPLSFVLSERQQAGWLFRAWPGGRKELSSQGARLVEEWKQQEAI